MKASRYYPEGRKYREEYPPTLHSIILFIRRVQAEISFLNEEEMQQWINLELKPWIEPLRERNKRRMKLAKNTKPTFAEFMEQRRE